MSADGASFNPENLESESMTVNFHPINSEASSFPAPKVAVTPVRGTIDPDLDRSRSVKSTFDEDG